MSNQARKEPHAAFALVAALRAIPTGLGIAYGRGRELLKRARFSIGLRVDRDKIDFDSGTGRGVRQESRVLPNSCWSDRLQPPPDGAFVASPFRPGHSGDGQLRPSLANPVIRVFFQ